MSSSEPTATQSFPSNAALGAIAAGVGREFAAKWAKAIGVIHWREPMAPLPLCGTAEYLATTTREDLLNCWSCALELILQRERAQQDAA